jgi:guanylate kinase
MKDGQLQSIPFLIVVSGPSGAGKSSITRRVLDRNPDLYYSVSITTRPIRGDEQDGVEYHFTDEDDFRKQIDKGEFIEWAHVHGAYYGTPRTPIEEAFSSGRRVLLDIDVQGGRQVREQFDRGTFIFIIPPSREVLLERLQGRMTDEPEVIQRRMEQAGREVEEMRHYQYIVTNVDLGEAVERVEEIIHAERRRVERIAGIDDWIRKFQG